MNRTTTECRVNTCVYWIPGNSCSADAIEVVPAGGSTNCSTFSSLSSVEGPEMKSLPQGPTASLVQGVTNPAVLCSARNCKHNRKGHCSAGSIVITGSAAQYQSDTECDMFEPT